MVSRGVFYLKSRCGMENVWTRRSLGSMANLLFPVIVLVSFRTLAGSLRIRYFAAAAHVVADV